LYSIYTNILKSCLSINDASKRNITPSCYSLLPVVFNVGLQLLPEIVHVLLHVVLEGGELLQVPVPHLVLPTLELGPRE
jgi:hypothetical protein